jgi:hypothetical protein
MESSAPLTLQAKWQLLASALAPARVQAQVLVQLPEPDQRLCLTQVL